MFGAKIVQQTGEGGGVRRPGPGWHTVPCNRTWGIENMGFRLHRWAFLLTILCFRGKTQLEFFRRYFATKIHLIVHRGVVTRAFLMVGYYPGSCVRTWDQICGGSNSACVVRLFFSHGGVIPNFFWPVTLSALTTDPISCRPIKRVGSPLSYCLVRFWNQKKTTRQCIEEIEIRRPKSKPKSVIIKKGVNPVLV